MSKKALRVLLLVFLLGTLLSVSAVTDPLDVTALRTLFGALNAPPQLAGWRKDGGDPCGEESWKGVSCSGQSIISIKIDGLGIRGLLGQQLSSFRSLKHLDVSNNCIGGEIPYSLPLNTTYMNLSHNSLFGPIGNVFVGMDYLNIMDLSFNNFTGDLPSSFSKLTELHELYLQENHFTGSVRLLTNLSLSILNLENNHFSGVLPKQFDSIPLLKIDGNMFQPRHASPLPSNGDPHSFPSNLPSNGDTRPFPSNPLNTEPADPIYVTVNASSSSQHSSFGASYHRRRSTGPAAVAGTVCGIFLMALLAAVFSVICVRRSKKSKLGKTSSSNDPENALPVNKHEAPTASHDQPSWNPSPLSPPLPLSVRNSEYQRISSQKNHSPRAKTLAANLRSASDLLIATDSYSQGNLIGEGFFGRVYRAENSDGQVFVVKKFSMVESATYEKENFLDVVWNMFRLRDKNIITLLGYCVDEGQYAVAYEYASKGSLADVLHFSQGTQKGLSWKDRLKIALGVARALEYMHCRCSPAMAHQNLKATNILLDEKLIPHLSDCGLNALRPIVNTNEKASRRPMHCMGYHAPEFGEPEIDETKMDIYSFGVIMLELLTGKKAFDSSRGREGQSLLKWASSRLHDLSSLEEMTDPEIKGSVSPKVLSNFADIILMCTQTEPQFRPGITVIGDHISGLIKKMHQHGRRSSAKGGSAESGSTEGGSAKGGSAEGGSTEFGSAEGGSAVVEPEMSDVSFKTTLVEFDR